MSARVVCFDLGGVVVRITRTPGEAFSRAGLDPARLPAHAPRVVHEHTDLYQRGLVSFAEFCAGIARDLGGGFSADDIRRAHDAVLVEPYAGVPELVHALHGRGLTTAILSNTNAAHWSVMASYEVLRAVPRHQRFASHELGLAKPDPALYERALRSLGVAADEVLFFDDMPENVAGARAAGWRAERVDFERPAEHMRELLVGLGIL